MNEIPQILESKEKVIWDGKPQYAPYITSAIIGSLIGAAILGIVINIFLKSILWASVLGGSSFIVSVIVRNLAYARTHYTITNKRTVIQSGIIGRDFKSIDYDRMQNVSAEVGLLGVIFKVGNIKIFTGEVETTGGKNPTIESKYDNFDYISSPYEVLKKLQTHLSVRKEKLH